MNLKRNALLIIFYAITFTSTYAQGPQEDKRRFIEVTGSAEMTIQPDEIELEVVLTESNKKPKMDEIETAFFELLKSNGINKEVVKIESSFYNEWWYWWGYKPGQYQSKIVHITLTGNTNFMKLAKDLHVDWVESTRIINATHKDLQRLRKEVKIEAMKAAKEKASYLLESVGEQPGKLLTVNEMPEVPQNRYYSRQSYSSNSILLNKTNSNEGIEQVDDITLRYEVTVTYEIK